MNRPLLMSVGLNIVLAIALLLCLKQCGNQPCPDATVITKWTDTVFVNEKTAHTDTAILTPIVRVIHKHKNNNDTSLSFSPTVSVFIPGSAENTTRTSSFYDCADTIEYSDTTYRKNEYRAVIHEQISGNKIIQRKLLFTNLSPQIVEHIDKIIPQRERVRVYLGVMAGFEASYSQKKISNFNLGPELIVTEPHGALLEYGYDAKNNGHRIVFAWKIKTSK